MDAYSRLVYAKNALQWENYTQGAGHDLNPLAERQHKVLMEMQASGTLPRALLRPLIETAPEVAALRNRLDDWDGYQAYGPVRSPGFVQAVRQDVVALLALRNETAQRLGFADYPAAIFASEGWEADAYTGALEAFVSTHIDETRALVCEHGLRWETWFTDLGRIGKAELDGLDALDTLKRLAEMLGKQKVLQELRLEQGQAMSFATQVAPGDIRVAVGTLDTLDDFRTLLHEFGHATYYASLHAQGPDAYARMTPLQDETEAVAMETIAPMLLCSPTQQKALKDLYTLEYARAAISALYELSLWKYGTEDAEDRYAACFGQLGVKVENPALWCLDSFRSIDCVYIGNYALGMLEAERRLDTTDDAGGVLYYGKDGRI